MSLPMRSIDIIPRWNMQIDAEVIHLNAQRDCIDERLNNPGQLRLGLVAESAYIQRQMRLLAPRMKVNSPSINPHV